MSGRSDQAPDVKAGRLSESAYAHVDDDIHPPLSPREALIEAARCHFCHDAPCVEACPTDAITHGHGFELATYNIADMVYRKEDLLAQPLKPPRT